MHFTIFYVYKHTFNNATFYAIKYSAYPATAYIKGFLNSKNVKATQMDLSIELFTAVFTKEFIDAIFKQADLLKN